MSLFFIQRQENEVPAAIIVGAKNHVQGSSQCQYIFNKTAEVPNRMDRLGNEVFGWWVEQI